MSHRLVDAPGFVLCVIVFALMVLYLCFWFFVPYMCKMKKKEARDRERKALQKARELAYRWKSEQPDGNIELPKTNFKQKLEFVF